MQFTLATIDTAVDALLPLLKEHTIFAFYAPMGGGKTTLISALCQRLGVSDATGSPTFAIVNEYALPDGGHTPAATKDLIRKGITHIYHFDFYRIKSLNEVYDIGYEDYFYSGQPCLIEWPELIEPLLPDDAVRVHITPNADNSRTMTIDLPHAQGELASF